MSGPDGDPRCGRCGSDDHTPSYHEVAAPACPRCGLPLLTETAAFSGLAFRYCDACGYVEE